MARAEPETSIMPVKAKTILVHIELTKGT